MFKGKTEAVCLSEKKGTAKRPVERARLIAGYGMEGDAHAGKWHRQISLLSAEAVRAFNELGGAAETGDFGENVLISGFDPAALPVGSIVDFEGGVRLKITQIGKECHEHCAIYRRVGDCIMPRKGVFAEVLKGGELMKGEAVRAEPPAEDRPFSAAVIVLSDKGSRGERKDESGPKAAELLEKAGYELTELIVIPDEEELLKRELIRLSDGRQTELILTSGGTGFSERDRTPEATLAVCERLAPGISEALRAYSMGKTPRAMFSRAVCGIRGKSLIINLPGSPKAVEESLEFLLPELPHGLGILRGSEGECARHD